MSIIPVSEARKKLGNFIDIAKYQGKIITFGRRGKAEAYLVAVPAEQEDFSITAINTASPSFAFLNEEPDLYTAADLKEQYV